MGALCWQVTDGLLRGVPRSVRDTKSQAMALHVLDPGDAAESQGRRSDINNSVDRLCWPRLRVIMFAAI